MFNIINIHGNATNLPEDHFAPWYIFRKYEYIPTNGSDMNICRNFIYNAPKLKTIHMFTSKRRINKLKYIHTNQTFSVQDPIKTKIKSMT